nr:unnamed protein product [Callosobruchus analis]
MRLKSEVFNTMQADRISYNGKSDPIICQYAEDYLRKHRRPHIKHAVSNKIRELGRLLIPLQDEFGIANMLEALKPGNYDKVVQAARIISGYDEEKRSFHSASLALHMRASLLGACAAANYKLSRGNKKYKKIQRISGKSLEICHGISCSKDLNEKHSSNPKSLPVTSDVILFKQYTERIADTCDSSLKKNMEDLESFKKLGEAILSLTIVLNRKRVGDVQYSKLAEYECEVTSTNQEECSNVLTESELALSKHFKRIVVVGKGSKPVPILFSTKLQQYMDTLLWARKKTNFVSKDNPYLFAQTGKYKKWIDGSKALRYFAVNSGAKCPDTLTSSRLRKQIATVLQILNLNEAEKEQVAKFMGHTKKTHEEFYRLPQDIFQTAKVAKLLLLMEKGETAENKGKTLDDIDLELQSWSSQENSDKSVNVVDKATCETLSHTEEDALEETSVEVKKCAKDTETKKAGTRGFWTTKQKSFLLSYFKTHVKNKTPPKKEECVKLIEERPDLFGNKNWIQLKVFVYNTYRTM